jgi:hypothetical protein
MSFTLFRVTLQGLLQEPHMTAKEVIEIVKESKLWESLTQKEKQKAIKHALTCTQLSITEGNIGTTAGEV